jgi:hypothetical protein
MSSNSCQNISAKAQITDDPFGVNISCSQHPLSFSKQF